MTRWLLCLIVCGFPAIAAAENEYLAELVGVAQTKHLAERPEWRALLHYRPRLILPGVESQADDAKFFLAADGKTNPQGELEATLAAFFSDTEETPTQQNPQCRFIARYHWLKQEIGFDPKRMPERPCRRFNEWRTALNPESLTLVFPAAYLNNPASLYGHTLLRVDAKDQDERTRLLAYAINYAAATDETNGLTFAVKGIFGGYPGKFSIAPYYAKVTEYNDLENRDIWEYQLNFTSQEIDRILMHVWELGPIRFDYYFFDENCSYHLLSLFDLARPELHLLDQFPAWVIPADTVRAVTQKPGLLRRATYRPARSTILRYREQRLSPAQVQLAKSVALGNAPLDQGWPEDYSETTRARILELAFEYLDYERLRGRTSDAARTATRLRELLLARSRMEVSDESPPPVPAVRPDQGHKSARVTVGVGRENGRGFQELQLRPAYHDLLDPDEGYQRGAEIEFLDVAVRHRERDGRTRVESVDLINITSLTARTQLLVPPSWRIDFGYKRKLLPSGDDPLVLGINGGSGFAWQPLPNLLSYAMIESALDANGHLRKGFSAGIGPAAGALLDVNARWRIQLEARALRYGAGELQSANEVKLNQRFVLGRDSVLKLEWSRRREFSQILREGGLSVSYYF